MSPDSSFLQVMKEFRAARRHTRPPHTLPHGTSNLKALPDTLPSVVWFGHSSYLLAYRGLRVLVDPVLSGRASPVPGFATAFDGTSVYSSNDLPDIDLLLLTHDHYDHLDYSTFRSLKGRVHHVVCALGVGAHLEYWGYPAQRITELNWWEQHRWTADVTITSTPARHFTGRLFRRGQTLWSSFVLQLFDWRVFVGGDSGYDAQFRVIGERFGPFDLAFLECGQYGQHWPHIHMVPEQTVVAAQDLGAATLFPVHWARFALANHPWNEPIQRLVAAARLRQQQFVSPLIGQTYVHGSTYPQTAWWEV